MGPAEIRNLLDAVRAGEIAPEIAATRLAAEWELPDATLDLARRERTGMPEVVYGEGKTGAQIGALLAALGDAGQFALATRVGPDKLVDIRARLPEVRWEPTARVVELGERPAAVGRIGVVTAGTSDAPVAEEAAVVAEALGNTVDRVQDVGVAGVHRLLRRLERLRACRALIVVAGMDGALPGVIAGLVRVPIVAVPTSVGYGAGAGGIAPLLTMLNACAPGVTVVNIDNGFGAAVAASRINHLGP